MSADSHPIVADICFLLNNQHYDGFQPFTDKSPKNNIPTENAMLYKRYNHQVYCCHHTYYVITYSYTYVFKHCFVLYSEFCNDSAILYSRVLLNTLKTRGFPPPSHYWFCNENVLFQEKHWNFAWCWLQYQGALNGSLNIFQ